MQMSLRKPSLLVPSRPLHAHLGATVRGTVHWRVLDEAFRPVEARDSAGRVVAPASGVTQPNLITNAGLDDIANGGTRDVGAGFRNWFRIGTGSTAPAFADTALVNQVETPSNAWLPFGNGGVTYELDTVTNEWVAYALIRRIITMTANRNLTEFGLSRTDVGTLNIRELFRDGGGTPITVSVLTGRSVLIEHTLEIRLPAPVAGTAVSIPFEQYNVGGSLASSATWNVTYGLTAASGQEDKMFVMWEPNLGRNIRAVSEAAWTWDRLSRPTFVPTSNSSYGVLLPESYTPGTHFRDKLGTVEAGEGTTTWYGAIFTEQSVASSFHYGLVVRFDTPGSYVKPATDQLLFTIRSSWARA